MNSFPSALVICLFAISLLSFQSSAQTSLGIKAGSILSTVHSDYRNPRQPESYLKTNWFAGLSIRRILTEHIELSAEVEFKRKEVTGTYSNGIYEYLSLYPQFSYFYHTSNYLTFGPELGWNVGQVYRSGNERNRGNLTETGPDVVLNLGVGHRFSEKVEIGTRYSHSLSSFNEIQYTNPMAILTKTTRFYHKAILIELKYNFLR